MTESERDRPRRVLWEISADGTHRRFWDAETKRWGPWESMDGPAASPVSDDG